MKSLSLFLISVSIFLSCRKEPHSKDVIKDNKPPIAYAGRDTVLVLPQDSVTIDGGASHDPDGAIKEYRWSKISGPASFLITQPQSAETKIKNLAKGAYQFELKVTDNETLFATDTVMITVYEALANNLPPVARAGQDLSVALPTNTVMLDGNGSVDPDNNIAAYLWSKISGPASFQINDVDAVQTLSSYLVEGVYQFELKITDAGGLSSRDTMKVTVQATNPNVLCEPNRPVISASLVPIGSLSAARIALVSAAAGSKIVFAGGMMAGSYSSRVDIYDTITKTWTTAELTKPERQGMAVAVVGNKILFAGGGDNDWAETTSRVDIYNVSNNTWSTAELSQAREYLAATTIGDKVFFAGGTSWETSASGYSTWVTSNVVDIYDNSNGSWTTAALSESRSHLTATTAGNKIYFAGGYAGPHVNNVSSTIDVFDNTTNSWSISYLEQSKASHASIALGNKIYWGVGIFNFVNSTFYPSNTVEIRDINTGASSHVCMLPKIMPGAVLKDDKIIFFPGNLESGQYSGSEFDIYNSSTNQWSIGQISREIYDATIISVNNTIYIAGGRIHAWGPYFTDVWKLEF